MGVVATGKMDLISAHTFWINLVLGSSMVRMSGKGRGRSVG
jgi:hypothetical protein